MDLVRVLFSSTSGYGHVLPMVPLARAFVAAGHTVLWATGADATRLVADRGLEAVPAGLAGPDLLAGRKRVHALAADVAPVERAAFVFPRLFGELLTAPMAADLLPLAREWRPDLLVHEHGELASPVVGAVLGVPSVTHAFGGAIPREIVDSAGWAVASVWAEHGLDPPPYAGCFTTLYLDICPRSVQSVDMGHIGAVHQLRPVEQVSHAAPDEEPPLVYLTLGTVQNRAPILPTIVAALGGLPVRVLVAVGPDGDPAALDPLPGNVRVERWVDQAAVLERCAVVVSHAGSGTFLGALAAGRPQLCLPLAADQFRNASGGESSGAALVLVPGQVSAQSVVDAVTRLLVDDTFAGAARVVSGEIAAMPSPAEVVDVLVGEGGLR
ncbi:glycosyltransferase [Nocardioides cavernae]|uniref:glycosyltransferase n=1 Tax=Nocardioides TaxID=1839 RepID=UPI000A7D1000|nr:MULTISPECIES: glycosyltransferase [Nocardioides]MCK9822144.1 glycosyltransferase [Nocardioides cavernae]